MTKHIISAALVFLAAGPGCFRMMSVVSNESDGGSDSGGDGAPDAGAESSSADGACCEEECVPTLGAYGFVSSGEPVQIDGQITLTNVDTNEVLFELLTQGQSSISAQVDEALLTPYEGSTINVLVEVEAEGYLPFSEVFALPIERTTLCCSTCPVYDGTRELELEDIIVDLTHPSGYFYTNPRFSPDGSKIAVLAYMGLAFYDILVIDLSGNVLYELGVGDLAFTTSSYGPAWSADGNYVYFASRNDTIDRVPSTGGVSEVVIDDADHYYFDVSRDGTQIVWVSYRDFTLQVGPIDRSTPDVDLGIYGLMPRFSPNGEKVAFFVDRTLQAIELSSLTTADIHVDESLPSGLAWFSDGERFAYCSSSCVNVLSANEEVCVHSESGNPPRDVDITHDDSLMAFGLNGLRQIRLMRGGF